MTLLGMVFFPQPFVVLVFVLVPGVARIRPTSYEGEERGPGEERRERSVEYEYEYEHEYGEATETKYPPGGGTNS